MCESKINNNKTSYWCNSGNLSDKKKESNDSTDTESSIFSSDSSSEDKNPLSNQMQPETTTQTNSAWAAPQRALNSSSQSNDIAKQYMANLQKDFGLTREQAAGIVGNLWHESAGMNSGVKQGGTLGQPSMIGDVVNQTGYGIAQWGEERKQGLINYAKANGLDPSSHAANYGFLKQELMGQYSNAIKAVKNTNNISGAAEAFMKTFEQPSNPELSSRLNYANQIYSLG